MQALSSLLEAATHAFASGQVERGTEYLALSREAATLSRSTFNVVLDISRRESGLVDPDLTTFDAMETIETVVAGFGAQAAAANVELRLRRGRSAAPVVSDYHLLSRIVGNLVGNAIKYADPAKSGRRVVLVSAVRLRNLVRLDVVDNGIGIERSQWEAIFNPFYQLGNKERDRAKGIGLGLSIVRSSLALMPGHRLDMTSNPGRGSRFSIELPIGDPNAATGRTAEGSVYPIANLEGCYCIYVEDDPLVRKSTVAVLQAHGLIFEAYATVEQLADGLASLEMTPDLILTDFRLPDEKSALDVVALIEAAVQCALPVIVLTGEESPPYPDHWAIVQKPVATDQLLALISATVIPHPQAPL